MHLVLDSKGEARKYGTCKDLNLNTHICILPYISLRYIRKATDRHRCNIRSNKYQL